MDDPILVKENLKVLSPFYAAVKSNDENIRFLFVTGVTHFSLAGLSFALNYHKDITFTEKYINICEFTDEEFDKYFATYLENALKALKSENLMPKNAKESDLRNKIYDWYDGYSWNGKTKVLNPISILGFFRKNQFSDYWIKTLPYSSLLTKINNKDPLALTLSNLSGLTARDIGP
jgi:hypothetical protein